MRARINGSWCALAVAGSALAHSTWHPSSFSVTETPPRNQLQPTTMAPYLPIPVPTWTTADSPSRVVARQVVTTVTVVATNDDCANCVHLTGGAIAGIVIGSIAGFLLLLWIIRSCFNLGAPPKEREKAWYKWGDEEPRHHHHHRHHHRSGSRRRGRSRSYRASSTYSVPAVVINERSRSSRRPRVYV